jgi:hypothetical protein
MSTAEERLTTAGMRSTVETPTTVFATAGTPTVTEMPGPVWTQTTYELVEIRENSSDGEKFAKKNPRKSNITFLL